MRQTVLFFIIMLTLLRGDSLPEYTLKSAYLYNFALLTDWPENEQSDTFNICFYREDFGAASDALNNKLLRERKVKISVIATPEHSKGCHMVLIREGEEQKGQKLIQHLYGKSVLLVGETPKIGDTHLTLLRENRKILFDVNLNTFKNGDLRVSSRLLKLARKIEN
jgi:hypothetical protein